VKSQSLIRRAISLVLIAELLCAIAFSGTALWHERRSRMRSLNVMIQGRSDSLLGAVQDAEDPDDNVTIDPAELNVPGSDIYAVYNQGGRLLGSSKDAPAALIERGHAGFSDRTVGGRTYRVLERDALRVIDRAENGGIGLRRPVTIVYGVPTAQVRREIVEAARFYLFVSLALLGITATLLALFLRRVLAPIEELAIRAGSVSKTSLHFEAPESALRVKELAPLAQTLSDTMANLRKAFEHEQRFVGDAAHELKTAVAVVRSTIQVLSMRARTNEEYSLGLERLLQDNQRVEDLVSRMLILARMEQSAEADSVVIDLGEAAQLALDSLASFAEARSVAIRLETEPKIFVHLTSEKAEVLLSNLIVNAVQHSPTGSAVKVELGRDGDKAILRVQDRGTGIAASALPHIFERFYREDSSRSRETGGAGLGLAISKSIVQSANGSISVESIPSVETVVIVSFTLA
jgi:signal transduction histidine kinase